MAVVTVGPFAIGVRYSVCSSGRAGALRATGALRMEVPFAALAFARRASLDGCFCSVATTASRVFDVGVRAVASEWMDDGGFGVEREDSLPGDLGVDQLF